MKSDVYKHLKWNFVVNIIDGAFFGLALGFSSFVTILPLFVSTLTSSPILIGLVPAFHNVGWQLPQLLTANKVTQLKHIKPLVMRVAIHERIPFFGLAVVGFITPRIGPQAALILTFIMLAWHGLGSGFTANPWQSMIAKIIPSDKRGSFFGLQSSGSNIFSSMSAVAAGFILERFENHLNYSICFFLTGVIMFLSYASLSLTKEPDSSNDTLMHAPLPIWSRMQAILKDDHNFRSFLGARILSHTAMMGFAFFTVYAVRIHHVSESGVGIMTGILLGTQIVANPIMGWIGDHWNNLVVLKIGIVAAILSALLAWWSPSPLYFYLVFALTGVAYVSIWTIGLAIAPEFGTEQDRSVYIGMSNTLVAPANILAPFLGGWLANIYGYPSTFLASAVCGVAALFVFQFFVKNPRRINGS